jgi:metal-responsive CopG/Arc/MetJ family transcriptional regulator
MVKQPKKRGRPPVGDKPMTQLAVRFPDELLGAIDEIVAERYGQSDRTSIIRELVAQALADRKRTRK